MGTCVSCILSACVWDQLWLRKGLLLHYTTLTNCECYMINVLSWSLNEGQLNWSNERSHLTKEWLYTAQDDTPSKPQVAQAPAMRWSSCEIRVMAKLQEFVWEYLRRPLGIKNTVKFSIKILHLTSTVHRLLSDRLLCWKEPILARFTTYIRKALYVVNLERGLEMVNAPKWVLFRTVR